jgi:hypothetical protein
MDSILEQQVSDAFQEGVEAERLRVVDLLKLLRAETIPLVSATAGKRLMSLIKQSN